MKKHMLKIGLAVAVVLGVGSIATGSVILANIGAPDQGPATAAGNANAMHQVLSETPDREIAAGNVTVAMVSGLDTVLTMAGSDPDPTPLAESGDTSPVAAASAGSAGVVGAAGISAASAGAGSVPSASGRNVQQAAMAMPLAAMPRPSSDSSARAGGSSAGPTGTRGPAASLPEPSATPETGTGTTPTEIAKVFLPELTDGTPDIVPHNYGPNDLPAILPPLDLNEPTLGPVITAGAKDPAASPGNTVPEPSTLALLGMVALGLVARRRRRA